MTLSFEPGLLQSAKLLAQVSGYRFSFSAYVNDLIRKDIQCRNEPTRLKLNLNQAEQHLAQLLASRQMSTSGL